MIKRTAAAIACLLALTAKAQDNPYPDVPDFEYVNYADYQGGTYVEYDYVDHSDTRGGSYVQYDYVDHQTQGDSYMDNRYYVDEMEPTHQGSQYGSGSYVEMDSGWSYEPTRYYDNRGDYRQVGEGTHGVYEEKGGWHYEPRHRGYESYGSRGNSEVHHHHHHHND